MFKENDEVKMTKDTSLWSKGDIGRIIIVDKSDTNLPYYVCAALKNIDKYGHISLLSYFSHVRLQMYSHIRFRVMTVTFS